MQNNISRDGPQLRKLADKTVFNGMQLTHCNTAEFNVAKQKWLNNLEEALQKRFVEFTTNDIVCATKIADMKSWPRDWESLKGY